MTTITAKSSDFHEALANALLFAGKEAMRPILNAVRIEFGDGEIRFIATDSYGLVRVKLEGETSESGEFLLSADDAKRILPIVKSAKGGTLEISIEADGITFSFFGSSTTARRVIGEFPNYSALFEGHEEGELGDIAIESFQLARLGKIKVGGKIDRVKFDFQGSNLKSARFTAGSAIDGIVMPVRTS